MTILILARHGRSTANAAGILAGRMPGVTLDDAGRAQAEALEPALKQVQAAYSSPMERCRQTAAWAGHPDAVVEHGLNECDYGSWSGTNLETLAHEELWSDIQLHPTAVAFPAGESMLAMQQRCLAAVRGIIERHPGEIVAVFSHGDPIKVILADALAMDFDEFQRIDVPPGSLSIIDYTGTKPLVRLIGGTPDSVGTLTPRGHTVGGSTNA